MSEYRIYVGWDSREPEAYEVCEHTLRKHASAPLQIVPIKQDELRAVGMFWRDVDPLQSTEFTYTRFLVPAMADFRGWALYCDCDFLWTADAVQLFEAASDETKAVACVHHDHRPTEDVKMDGKVQTTYPRKNWSSMMLFNCDHPSTRTLTPDVVNRETGAYLHRMQWARDEEIGAVDPTWNWLEGSSPVGPTPPNVVHYTRGGPWFENYRDVQYGDLWLHAHAEARAQAPLSAKA